jgi:hypothetical protein
MRFGGIAAHLLAWRRGRKASIFLKRLSVGVLT